MRRIAILASAAATLATVVGSLAIAPNASATTYHPRPTQALTTVPDFKYQFWNYDYDTNAKYVDNPVTMIFVSSSSDMVDHVYSEFDDNDMALPGDAMQLQGVGPSRPGVNVDPWTSTSHGKKGAFGCWGGCDSKTDIHVRTYGPDGQQGTQVYQGSYGYDPYYLVATVHFDRSEGTSSATFGYQDQARGLLVDHMTANGTWRVLGSVPVAGTACQYWFDASHYCDSDGNALVISIDG